MYYTSQNRDYDARLAGDLLKACENGTADFLNTEAFPYYTQDMLSGLVLHDAAQLQTLLSNAAYGSRYINYAPTYIIQDSERELLKNASKNPRETGCVVYMGKDENGNKRYEMVSPVNKLSPGWMNESPMAQNPVPNIGINRQTPVLDTKDPKGIEKYVTAVIANYFNAAFTKTPYFAPQWGGQETAMLSNALSADPSLALRVSQNAFSQAASVNMANTVNRELNDNVMEAIRQGLPPFNTQKQSAPIGPVNGVLANGALPNGADFVNSYYGGINGAASPCAQYGYIPYQTYDENPKNIDRFLVERYGDIMNASLTGTPYSGSVTPAQINALSSGIKAKMANDPAYMSRIANQARQNVLGFNYMPYDKDDFIRRAQDPSSREFKLLDQIIASHINDICKKNKQSFNGEFQELSKDLTEKIKTSNAAAAKTPAARTSAASKTGTSAANGAASGTAAKTPATGTSATSKTGTAAKKPSTRTSSASKTGTSAANTAKKTSTRTSSARKTGTASANGAAAKTPAAGTSAANETGAAVASAAAAGAAIASGAAANSAKKEERPSFFGAVTDFVKKNIAEKKGAQVLTDTFLGNVADKAQKIARTGKSVAAALVIAANVLAPNLQLPIASRLANIPVSSTISVDVNSNNSRVEASGNVNVRVGARRGMRN